MAIIPKKPCVLCGKMSMGKERRPHYRVGGCVGIVHYTCMAIGHNYLYRWLNWKEFGLEMKKELSRMKKERRSR